MTHEEETENFIGHLLDEDDEWDDLWDDDEWDWWDEAEAE